MKEKSVTMPELALIIGTRVAFGVGVGLLLGERLSPDMRKGAGRALLAVGALSTIPLAMTVLARPDVERRAD
jgi:hypothetical protein